MKTIIYYLKHNYNNFLQYLTYYVPGKKINKEEIYDYIIM